MVLVAGAMASVVGLGQDMLKMLPGNAYDTIVNGLQFGTEKIYQVDQEYHVKDTVKNGLCL